MFKPWSGTSPRIGSVAKVTSIYPRTTVLTVFWIFPVTLIVLTPSPSVTLRLSCISLCTRLSPLFLSWTACQPVQGPTPPSVHRPSMRSLSCLPWPAPQVPFGPAPRSRFSASSPVRSSSFSCPRHGDIPFNTCEFSLLGFILIPPFLVPFLPLAGPICIPVPVGTEGSCVSSSWPPVLLCHTSSSLAPVMLCLLVSSGILASYGRPFALWQEAWASPLPVSCPPQPSSPRYSYMPATFRPPGSSPLSPPLSPPLPPCVLLIPSPSVSVFHSVK